MYIVCGSCYQGQYNDGVYIVYDVCCLIWLKNSLLGRVLGWGKHK